MTYYTEKEGGEPATMTLKHALAQNHTRSGAVTGLATADCHQPVIVMQSMTLWGDDKVY